MLAFETLLGQPVHGVVAAVDRSGVEPVHPRAGIPHFQIIREVQFGKRVLGHQMSLLRRLFEPVPGIRRVGYQQRPVPPEFSHQVLRVHITAFRQLFHFRDGFAALLHGQALVPDHIPQCPVVVGGVAVFLRLVLLIETLLLEADLTQVQALHFLNDRVLDLPELLLL